MTEAILYAEKQARERLGGLGRTKFYELLAAGELESVQVGRRRFVPAGAIEAYVDRLRAEQNGPSAA